MVYLVLFLTRPESREKYTCFESCRPLTLPYRTLPYPTLCTAVVQKVRATARRASKFLRGSSREEDLCEYIPSEKKED